MSEDHDTLSCTAFQAQLPELIGANVNLSEHSHLQSCELCRALMADLETIAEAARQLFPIVEPRDDVWKQIESRLESEDDRKLVEESENYHKTSTPQSS
jgi:predicted anti-sigma-YlaC factor YlaD